MAAIAVPNPVNLDPKSLARKNLAFSETASHYLVRFEMPEVLGDEVSVEISNGELVVKGRGRPWMPGSQKRVTLKLAASRSGVFAHFRDGVLIVALPKTETLEEAALASS